MVRHRSPVARRSWSFVASVAVGLVWVLAVGAAPAAADPQDDRTRVNRALERTRAALETATDRAAAAIDAYEEANRRLPLVQNRLADARAVLAGAKARARTAARAAAAAKADLATANRALTAANRTVDQTSDAIERHVVDAYKNGTIGGVNALLSAGSPAEFVAGLTYLGQVAAVQRATLDANTRARVVQRDRQSVQAGRQRDAVAAAQRAADAVDKAAGAEAAAEQAAQDVAHLVAQKAEAMRVAESERAAVLKRYQELQAESARIAAEIQALARAGGPVVRPGARLPMPVVGWKSSDFGMRYDPYYKVWQLHAGVDLAAPAGTPIWAAAAGKVIRAGWNGGYGNYTCIYHGTYQGKGFATCYAHQSRILVSVGQQVHAGQVIGRVGTTGASTGNHLHFEVRLDGTPVDPVPWLPACLC